MKIDVIVCVYVYVCLHVCMHVHMHVYFDVSFACKQIDKGCVKLMSMNRIMLDNIRKITF